MNNTWAEPVMANVTSMNVAVDYINSITNNTFGAMLLLSIFTTSFIVFRKQGEVTAFTTSSFICFVLAGILTAIEISGDMWFVLFGAMTAVGIWASISKK